MKKEDSITGEIFARIVGRRLRPPLGQPPTAAARAAHASFQQYQTRAPKGIFVYHRHEEMEADRLKWTVEAVVHRALLSKPPGEGPLSPPEASTSAQFRSPDEDSNG